MKFMKGDLLAVTDCAGNESLHRPEGKQNLSGETRGVVIRLYGIAIRRCGAAEGGSVLSAVPENRMSPCEGWIRTVLTFMTFI